MKRSFQIAVSIVLLVGIASIVLPYAADAQTVRPTPPKAAAPSPTPVPSPPVEDEDDEPIRVDTELVNLNVRVVDRNGRTVNDVPQRDFTIYEDGVAQTIDFFSKSEIPTNYGIVVDNSGSIAPQLEKVIEAGSILINQNKPADETLVIRFVGRDKIEILQDFTSNKTDLLDSLDQFMKEGGQTAIIDAVYLAIEKVEEHERSKNAADRKRRAIILITDGEDRDSFYTEKQLFDLLRESETQIYTIGFVSDLSTEGGFISKSPQAKAKAFLERIASESGGKAYFPSSNMELPEIARQISNELRTQYSIGYLPTNSKNDGTFRNIKVSVADGPNKQKRIAIARSGRIADGKSSPNTLTPKPAASTTKP
jgi:Ca-activated chloride channel homolog